MKLYRFFFHYNKPASKANGRPMLSVHFRGKCYIVTDVSCGVPTYSKVNKKQPYCVMQGKARDVRIMNRIGDHFAQIAMIG